MPSPGVRTIVEKHLKKYHASPSARVSRFMANNLIKFWGDNPISKITGRDIKRYRLWRRVTKRVAASTINREVGLFRTLLRDALDAGDIKAINVVRWHQQKETCRSRVITDAEYRRVLEEMPSFWRRQMVSVLMLTGLRVTEALSIKKEDIEFKDNYATGIIRNPKEGDDKIVVFVGAALHAARLGYVSGKPRLFGRTDSTTPAQDYDHLGYQVRLFIKKSGMDPFTIHDLRRTFASRALRNGASLEEVGQTLGHKSVHTTRRYARIDAGVRHKVATAAAQ